MRKSLLRKVGCMFFVAVLLMSVMGTTAMAEEDANSDEVYKLTFTMHTPADSVVGTIFQGIFDEINEKTDGRVEIEIFGSGTLAAINGVYDIVKAGGCDIGWLFTPAYPGEFPVTDGFSLPMMGALNCEQGTEVLWDCYEKYDSMREEFSDFKMLMIYPTPASCLYTNTPVSKLSDLAGMSIRNNGGPSINKILSDGGANPIVMPPSDLYDGLVKNNIQGYVAEHSVVADYSLESVTPYVSEVFFNQGVFSFAMNKEKYESLPADIQAVFDEYSTREASLALARELDQYIDATFKDLTEGGMEVVPISDEDYADFVKSGEEYANSWVEENTTADFDAKEFYEFCKNSYAEHAPTE